MDAECHTAGSRTPDDLPKRCREVIAKYAVTQSVRAEPLHGGINIYAAVLSRPVRPIRCEKLGSVHGGGVIFGGIGGGKARRSGGGAGVVTATGGLGWSCSTSR